MEEDSFSTQILTCPTRENNIFDLVLVIDPNFILDCKMGEELNGCNHYLIGFSVRIENQLPEKKAIVLDY